MRFDKFNKTHVKKLTVTQMKAVYYVDCGGKVINGKAVELRSQLIDLLYDDLGTPEYPTQDDVVESAEEDSSSESVSIQLDVSFDSMIVSDCVEVYWCGEDKWFQGEIIEKDMED